MSRGTPKTLNGAIQNAFEEYKKGKTHTEGRLRKLVKNHVQDWVRNAVAPIALESELMESSVKAINRLAGRR
jgi:hypothetical protein